MSPELLVNTNALSGVGICTSFLGQSQVDAFAPHFSGIHRHRSLMSRLVKSSDCTQVFTITKITASASRDGVVRINGSNSLALFLHLKNPSFVTSHVTIS